MTPNDYELELLARLAETIKEQAERPGDCRHMDLTQRRIQALHEAIDLFREVDHTPDLTGYTRQQLIELQFDQAYSKLDGNCRKVADALDICDQTFYNLKKARLATLKFRE